MRRGVVIRSFVDGRYGSKGQGAEIDVPSDADWIEAGLVEEIKGPERATVKAPETAVLPTPAQPKTKMQITAVSGLGPGTAKRLAQIGIKTIDELAAADPVRISGLPKIGLSTAQAWVAEAKELRNDGND